MEEEIRVADNRAVAVKTVDHDMERMLPAAGDRGRLDQAISEGAVRRVAGSHEAVRDVVAKVGNVD